MEFEHHLVARGENFPQFVQVRMFSNHFPDVVAGAERLAVSPDDEDGYFPVFSNIVKGASDRVDHLQGKRIPCLGAVQREPAERTVFLQ